MSTSNTTPRVYVGTYAKYNEGWSSIAGEWLSLEDYSDKEAFLTACKACHSDEADPEFMFQDHEGIPAAFISESHIDEALWDWLELDDDGKDLLAAFQGAIDHAGTIDEARDAFLGRANTEADFAEQWLEETGGLEGIPEHLRGYFDYAAYGRDMRLGGEVYFVRFKGELWAFSAT